MTWHTDAAALDRYANRTIDDASAFSIEAHLMTCAVCRGTLAAHVEDASRLDRMWTAVVDGVDRPRASLTERALCRLGVPGHVARIIAVTARVPASGILAAVILLGLPVFAARTIGGEALPFLIVAPIVTAWGVALLGPSDADPLGEIGVASPVGGFRLALLRTTVAMMASMGLSAVAALALPSVGGVAVAWLLPSFALGVLTLATATAVASTRTAAVIVSSVWVAAVMGVRQIAAARYAAFGLDAQFAWGAVALASILFVVARREAFETGSVHA
jgi:hypothetical protein